MIPDNVLSSSVVSSPFTGANSLSVTKVIDYEDGGIALQDPSEGLMYQRWRGRVAMAGTADSYITLSAPSVPEFVALTLPNLEEMSFAFDQSMFPAIAYVQDGASYLWWYDGTVPGMATLDLGEDVITPRITYDDKRIIASQGYLISDLILAYVKNGNLYVRMQRDRFLVEYLMAEGVAPLIKIGLNRGLRLQFMLEAS